MIRKNVENLKTSDAVADSLIEAQNYETALYRLSPMLADSTLNENLLFSIVQLAAHKEKTYLSSIFTKSVQMAILRNPQRLCKLLDELSVAILDNKEVKKMYCNTCKWELRITNYELRMIKNINSFNSWLLNSFKL